MRYVSKAFFIAVGLFSIGVLSSSVSANTLLAGNFTLDQPTQWKSTVLPAGKYTFKLAHNENDVNRLTVYGKNKTFVTLIFPQSACETCKNGALQVAAQGSNRVVTSLELPGFHVNYKAPQSQAEREQQMGKLPTRSEQIAVHVDSN